MSPSTERPGAAAPIPAAFPLAFAAAAMRAPAGLGAPGETLFRGAATDSRRVEAGNLFFALPGQRVDGFAYCAEAERRGAVAVVVAQDRGRPVGVTVPVLAVADPLSSLGELARAVRGRFSGKVVAITGSNGKTTTKELCAAALGAAGKVWRTEGNYNTEVGLPLTILAAAGDEEFWVLEMAMRGRHQIALLTDIARPDVGLITNVGAAHLELLGSLEEVSRAKGELFAGLGPDAIAVLPAGDVLLEAQAAHLPEARKRRFDGGRGDTPSEGVPGPTSPDVAILETTALGGIGQRVRYRVGDEEVVAQLPLAGIHNARNAAAALTVAHAFAVRPAAAAAALAGTVLPPHRSAPHAVAERIVIDDCYNANPSSMRAALTMLAESVAANGPQGGRPGGAGGPRAFAVLADMLELGPDSVALHREVGREAAAVLTGLGVVGELGAHIAAGARAAGLPSERILAGDDPVAVAATVASWTAPGDFILVKASRGMRLERAVEALLARLASGADVPTGDGHRHGHD